MLAAPRPPRTAAFTNRQVSNFYFRSCRDQYDEVILEYYRCRCGAVRKREHPSYSEEMLAATPGQTGSLAHYVRHSAQYLFGWLEWLVKCNLPLSFCESKLARRYTRLQSVSVETLRRVMDAVTRCVEHSIAAEMPEEFGLIFDGHQAFLATMLARDYQKRLDQVLVLVGDNCGVNRRLATLMGLPLVGFKTDLRPIIRQQTRWGSTFAMINRYFELLPFIDAEDDELAELLPPAASKRRLRDLLGELKDVESVSKALQRADANPLDVCVWFDGLIAAKPSYARYLAPRADIVHSPDFEAGCVKVLKEQAKRLTRVEKAALDASWRLHQRARASKKRGMRRPASPSWSGCKSVGAWKSIKHATNC
ncbi:hypothetical protein PHYSODRAFT_246570 [Phytophthora sojae]|uniref:Uncharacterized protein n=1 Tax=Phytophthora sojae (strain P6497) TaxID=1094619 RepID=G5ADA4_PHYSP|nr:hypothetical protein PHYSODRAFT_246570 [Phytophthora sojae]EGZ06157.1 hypothetical protein PHYSODRAFT_246570 [Phytophthora sojae]|eukprot:XP_009538054.1 hypothetical protein PHYSODRAFT_246570 [Phytophthora sojae]